MSSERTAHRFGGPVLIALAQLVVGRVVRHARLLAVHRYAYGTLRSGHERRVHGQR